MKSEWINEDNVRVALKNIQNYINELDGKVNIEVIQKLKYYYEQTETNKSLKRFNLVYRNSNGKIKKICNESFFYEYTENGETFYRTRTEIDGDKPYIYPCERVKENKAEEDLEVMQSRPVICVDMIE